MIEYHLADYGSMLLDKGRVLAYRAAMRKRITPGAVVVDLGCGPGAMSLWALEFGADHVYAIDTNPSIAVLREAARAPEFEGRITVLDAWSTSVELPRRADVIVSDLRGVLPLHRTHVASIVDARRRLLRPGGHLIAASDSLYVAPVRHQPSFDRFYGVWGQPGMAGLEQARVHTASEMCKIDPTSAELCADPQRLGVIDYRTVSSPDFAGAVEFRSTDASTWHGMMVWFDTELAEDIGFSNGPTSPLHIYGAMYFPLASPLAMTSETTVRFAVDARSTDKGDYRWRWQTEAKQPGTEPVLFDQSSFAALHSAPSLQRLRRTVGSFRPRANADAELVRSFLRGVDANESLDEMVVRAKSELAASTGIADDELVHRIQELSVRFGA